MIPKKIHYCWFGGNPLPELAQRCIASWEKYCPEYEIICWDEQNFDVNCCDYVTEAYAAKKWAFVSDYARFWILYQEGGVYFDTDVELIRPIDDILTTGAFAGCERGIDGINGVAPGLGLASESGNEFYRRMLEQYEQRHFLKLDGTPDTTTVVHYTTAMLKEYGWRCIDEYQIIAGIHIYPAEYFCPMNYVTYRVDITPNTRSIHHYAASWISKTPVARLKQLVRKLLSPRFVKRVLVWKNHWRGNKKQN